MPAKRIGDCLPGFLSPRFWETNLEELRVKDNTEYIIERVIGYGDDRAITWLRSAFTPEQIISVVRSSRRISPNGVDEDHRRHPTGNTP